MMKKIFLLTVLLKVSFFLNAQVHEDFSDGNITEEPVWTGNTAAFAVTTEKQLRLQTTGPDTVSIATSNQIIKNAQWDFWLKMSFNTSANNFARIYLISDQADLLHSLNGYYIQAGGSDDSVSFVRQKGTSSEILFKGKSSFTGNSTNIIRFRILHDEDGMWHLFSDNTGGNNLTEEGSAFDTSLNTVGWFGIFCRFTSSNATKFYFDDIYAGHIVTDTVPPAVLGVSVMDSVTLEVNFTEPVDNMQAENPENYLSMSEGHPVMATLVSPAKAKLIFAIPFNNEFIDTLLVENIGDMSGNILKDQKMMFFKHTPRQYDIQINEILADPDPPAGLPVTEFIELHNRSSFPADITDWTIEYGSSRKTFPKIIIEPQGYLIITKGNFYDTYCPSTDLFTSMSSLSNEGTLLVLRNEDGRVIHSVEYSKEWYQDKIKEEGGWSLEMKDPDNPCGCAENWSASKDPAGGTPGKINSIFSTVQDTTAPYIKALQILGDTAIGLILPEKADTLSADNIKWFIQDEEIDEIRISSPFFDEVILIPAEPLIRGIQYHLKHEGYFTDCAGNHFQCEETTLAVPDTVSVSDIIINEVLPDPYTDGARFVELYNRSDRISDLKDLVFSSWDSVFQCLKDTKSLSGESRLFLPGEYLVLTNDQDDIKTRYLCGNDKTFIILSSLPSMSNDYGDIVLSRKYDGMIIDRMKYSASSDFPLLNDPEGVSLERVSPDAGSLQASNWHSASSSCGYATPGLKNSQNITPEYDGGITIAPPVFSPDNDGKDDILTITAENASGMFSIRIFDDHGRFIKQLVNNEISGGKTMVFWDGTDENGSKVPFGIYIIYIEITDETGKISAFKNTAVVTGLF